MTRYVSKSEFARMAGRTPSSISQASRREALSPAVVGNQIDVQHPSAIQYLQRVRRGDQMRRRGGRTKPGQTRADAAAEQSAVVEQQQRCDISPGDVQQSLQALPEDIRKLADMTLRQILKIFGTARQMKDFLDATNTLETIHKLRLANAKSEGEVVLRETVERGIVEPMNAAHKMLLMDGSKTIARHVMAMTQAGETAEVCEKWVETKIGDFLKAGKKRIRDTLDKTP